MVERKMTGKELNLEECVNLLSAGAAAKNKTPPPHLQSKMIRRNSKADLRTPQKCTIRLLDDVEVLQCEFQVRKRIQVDLLDVSRVATYVIEM